MVLLALIGVWSLAPDSAWGGAPAMKPADAPAPLAYLARILPPFGVVIGVYMFWVGADAPWAAPSPAPCWRRCGCW